MEPQTSKEQIGQEAGKEVANASLAYYEACQRKMQRAFSPAFLSRELKLIAAQDMADFIEVDKKGVCRVRSLSELRPGRSRIIKKIKQRKKTRFKSKKEKLVEVTTEFELHDKLDAIRLGAEISGAKRSKMELSGKDGAPLSVIVHPPGEEKGAPGEVEIVKPG